MPLPIDLTGRRFGSLTVLSEAEHGKYRRRWLAACDCGQTKIVDGGNLSTGNTTSCGCLRSALLSARNLTHGQARTPEWFSWINIFQRCNNPANPGYHRYGGRGIRVCNRWSSFEDFLADMGARPPGTTIDRINNDGDYEPGNCRWATTAQQMRNRSITLKLTFAGETMPLIHWAERADIRYHTLVSRIKAGWPIERALTKRAAPFGKEPRSEAMA